MQELFWIIVGYTLVLTVCFLLGEYLQNRRAQKSRGAKKDLPPPGGSSDDPCL